LAEGGLKIEETSFNFTNLEYATRYEAKIVSGRTENENDIFGNEGTIIAFQTPGIVEPTSPPTELPTDAPTEPPSASFFFEISFCRLTKVPLK